MDEQNSKRLEIMPNPHKKGIKRYMGKDTVTTVNIRIMIVIAIFSLILIFLGTIILLNSYNPKANKISSNLVRQTPTATQGAGINIPSAATKPALLSLQSKIDSYTTDLQTDESNFDNLVK